MARCTTAWEERLTATTLMQRSAERVNEEAPMESFLILTVGVPLVLYVLAQ